jgi:radical SAM protein with 4Fe4S-binding SPASM domain
VIAERPVQPLVLRPEPFGGILFDPVDGTHLELDRDGYGVVARALFGREPPATDEERAFFAEVAREVPAVADPARQVRGRETPTGIAPLRHAMVFDTPSLVDLQITNRCTMGCPQCYSSSTPDAEDMPLADAERLLRELAAAGVCQMAIGGGEPLLHPDIVRILELCRDLGIVANLTTTGIGLSPRVLDAMASSCGAVALSLEDVGEGYAVRRRMGFDAFEAALAKLLGRGLRVGFQVTLSAQNLARLPAIIDYALTVEGLYGVIFLAYKPVGRGDGYETPLSAIPPDELYPWLRHAFVRLSKHTKVGYDCCLTPGIAGIDLDLGFSELDLLEGCSAARTSVGIGVNLDVMPCTFTGHRALGNLREKSFTAIWADAPASAFRAEVDALGDHSEACTTCRLRDACLGGCPEWDLVRCRRQGPRTES